MATRPAASFQACTAAAGDSTLRGAILKANGVPGPHTITLPAGTYTLIFQGSNEDAAVTGDLDINQNITINGVNPSATVVAWDAAIPLANRERIFHVLAAGSLTIRDMSIRLDGNGADRGGGVYSRGTLVMERVSSRLHAAGDGGGLAVESEGSTIVRDSAINGNTSVFAAGVSLGFTGTVLIENSTINENVATSGSGGGIYVDSVSSNVVTLNNVTVSHNSAGFTGGGIYRNGNAPVVLRNTIIANNAATVSIPNCAGTILSQGYNFVFGGDTCGMSVGNNDIVNTGDPRLGIQQLNGGPTATRALGSGSAALDRGNPAPPGSGGDSCAARDQRGFPRTLDGNGDGVARCDIGAAEGGRWLAVDTTIDSNAAGFQVCDDNLNNTNCSLRGAISLANGGPFGSAAVLTLPATGAGDPYRLTVVGAGENANATGDLDILSDMTIVGGGASTTIIDGNQSDRVFHVVSGASRALRLQDLSVQNGDVGAGFGGGIYATAQVTLLRSRVQLNRARDGGGLHLYMAGYSSTITDSTISGNSASLAAGIWVSGMPTDTMTIVNSTIANNVAQANGGGLFINNNTVAILANVTLAGNQASGAGGLLSAGSMTVRNSIIANNTGSSPNCSVAGLMSQGHNLVFGGSTCGFTKGTDKQNQDPKLGPLQFNGGQTETMSLGPGSAAVDAGNPGTPGSGGLACSATDQRGAARPIDGDAIGGPRCDIGAFEAAFCAASPNVSLGVQPGGSGRLTVNVTGRGGNITELRLHAQPSTNVLVSVGSLVDQSGELTVPVNAPSAQLSLRRTSGAGAGTLPFEVVDGCGVWKTFAGGGPSAGSTGGGASSEPSPPPPPSPEPPRTTQPVRSSCGSRGPNIHVATIKKAPGQMQATITARTEPGAPGNALRSIAVGSIEHAEVSLNGAAVTAGQVITLPSDTAQVTLLVARRAGEDPARSSTVAFVVTDECGEWKSFVGGGPGAF